MNREKRRTAVWHTISLGIAIAAILGFPTASQSAPIALVVGNRFPINNGQTTTTQLNFTDLGIRSLNNPSDPVFVPLSIRNLGDAPLHVTGPVTFTGPGAESFDVILQPSPGDDIASGTSTNINVKFDPISTATGTQTAIANIPTDDPDQTTYTFTMTGFGSLEDIASEVDLKLSSPNKSFQKKCDKLGVCRLKARMPISNIGNTDLTSGVLRIYLCHNYLIDENAVQLEDIPIKKLKAPKKQGGKVKIKKVVVNAIIPDEDFSFYYVFAIPTDGTIENNMVTNFYGLQLF